MGEEKQLNNKIRIGANFAVPMERWDFMNYNPRLRNLQVKESLFGAVSNFLKERLYEDARVRTVNDNKEFRVEGYFLTTDEMLQLITAMADEEERRKFLGVLLRGKSLYDTEFKRFKDGCKDC